MSTQTVQLKDALRVIPEFGGGNESLTPFLEACDQALSMIDPANEASLVKLIRSKLVGEARSSCHCQVFSTVEELKDFLKSLYYTPKSIYQLQGELAFCFQLEGESVNAFANRMREIGNRIVETYKYENSPTKKDLERYRASTEKSLMEFFRRNLKPEIDQKLVNENNMMELVKKAIRVEKDIQARQQLRGQAPSSIRP